MEALERMLRPPFYQNRRIQLNTCVTFSSSFCLSASDDTPEMTISTSPDQKFFFLFFRCLRRGHGALLQHHARREAALPLYILLRRKRHCPHGRRGGEIEGTSLLLLLRCPLHLVRSLLRHRRMNRNRIIWIITLHVSYTQWYNHLLLLLLQCHFLCSG